MELYQLNSFVKIADEGSLTRAAQLLFTSQPAISAQIKALEEELGVALFERSSRGMQLTAKGHLLYQQAVETLNAAARFKGQAQELQQELVGELRIGVHTDFEFMRIGELYQRLNASHPRIGPHLIQSMSARILTDIRRGVLDGGFFFGPCRQAELTVYHLADIPMRIVGPARWQARIASASLDELAQLPWVYTSDTCPFYGLTRGLFEETGNEPDRVAYVDSEDAVRELIRAGAGVSLLREDDADGMQARGEAACWTGETPSISLSFAVQRQRAGEPLVDALQSVIAGIWPERDALADSAGA